MSPVHHATRLKLAQRVENFFRALSLFCIDAPRNTRPHMRGKNITRKVHTTTTALAYVDDASILLEVQRRNLFPLPRASPTRACATTTTKNHHANSGGGTPCWWSCEEDNRLADAVQLYGIGRINGASVWPTIAKAVGTRTQIQCRRRWDYTRCKNLSRATITKGPAAVEVSKALDVNAFFDHQLCDTGQVSEVDDRVMQHYGLLALETLNDADTPQEPKDAKTATHTRRVLSIALDGSAHDESTDLFVLGRRRYEDQLCKQQAEVTLKEVQCRLALQRAANLETIVYS